MSPKDSPQETKVTAGGGIPTGTIIGGRNLLTEVAQAVPGAGLSAQCYRLCVERGGIVGTLYSLRDGETKVGKAKDNDVVLDHPTVSRTHFAIVQEGDRYLLRDLGSTNGTFLDGAQVREAYLRPGAQIEAGDVALRFQPDQVPVQIAPSESNTFGRLVGESLRMRELFALLAKIAPTDASVVILGETGTGKGSVAHALHEHSKRAAGPFMVVDCAAISKTLIESELFGHERGAFTGAVNQRAGLLELAAGGTLFLDQIEDLDLDLQPKLLRALEERVFRRVGSSTVIRVDARVIAASRKDLWVEVAQRRFREDLFFRLSVFTLTLPPLRERKEDIPSLVDNFAEGPIWKTFRPAIQELFSSHSWPGNLRELRNAVERAQHLAAVGSELRPEALLPPSALAAETSESLSGGETLSVSYGGTFKETKEKLLAAFEREYLTRLLHRNGGNIARAAREAEVDRKYLYSLLKKHSLGNVEGEG
jgi:DNA-binding NtrC family response regulator